MESLLACCRSSVCLELSGGFCQLLQAGSAEPYKSRTSYTHMVYHDIGFFGNWQLPQAFKESNFEHCFAYRLNLNPNR
jgi:hypothetical protein